MRTWSGETSGIITKGTGPIPIANELRKCQRVRRRRRRRRRRDARDKGDDRRARDADASELGLFTLVSQPAAVTQPRTGDEEDVPPPALGEIVRAEIPAATPLRKPTGAGRIGAGQKEKEKEKAPEVYVEAALKYLDR